MREQWTAVDAYLTELFAAPDQALDLAEQGRSAAGMPDIAVSPPYGKLLHLLARIVGARRVLEIGTLSGYSTVWLARGLADGGSLLSLELDPAWAETARASLAAAGFGPDRAEVRVGVAQELLPAIEAEGGAPFDLVFIDADKRSNPVYLDWAIRLGRPGTVIVLDNVVRGSTHDHAAVLDADSGNPDVEGTRAALRLLADDPRVDATAIQTVGVKGWDGFALARVR